MSESLPFDAVTVPEAFDRARWLRMGGLWLIAVLAVIALYWESAASMLQIWISSETFTHAFVVPVICGWLVWRDRAAWRVIRPAPSAWALPVVLLIGLLWLLGALSEVNSLMHMALVGLLILTVPAVLGLQVARSWAFPLGFLLFCVPFGEFLMPSLMALTADFTVSALRWSGVPVYREGLQFVIPSGQWSVVEACSGLRYLIASVMVGTLFAYLNFTSLKRRLAFVAVAVLVPLGANWVRAYLIVMLGHLSSNRLAAGADHLIYGWVFFGFVMFLMFMIGARWQEPASAKSWQVSVPEASAPRGAGLALLGLAVLIALPASLWMQIVRAEQPQTVQLNAPPVNGFEAKSLPDDEWRPHFSQANAMVQQRYRRPQEADVGLYLAYYRQQGAQRKLVSSTNVLVASQDTHWAVVSRTEETVDLNGRPWSARAVQMRGHAAPGDPGVRLMALQWFWIQGALTDSDSRAKLYQAWNRLTGRGDDGAVVVVYTRVEDGESNRARERLHDFLKQAWPSIESSLQGARSSVGAVAAPAP